MKRKILFGLIIAALASSVFSAAVRVVNTPYSSHMDDVVIRGNYAYCAMGTGLLISDVTDPAAPEMISHLLLPLYYSRDIKVSGDYAYIIDQDSLITVNISNLMEPYKTDAEGLSGDPREIAIDGSMLYIAGTLNGFSIYDIAAPDNPQFVSRIDTIFNYIRGIAVDYPYVYLAAGSKGPAVYDVSDPENPAQVSELITYPNYYSRFVIKSDTILFINMTNDQFGVVNIADPYNPQLISRTTIPNDLEVMVKSGNYVFTSDNTSGTQIVDVSDLLNPTIAATINIAGKVEISGDTLFILRGEAYYAYDISNLADIVYLGKQQAPRPAGDIAFHNNKVVTVGDELITIDVTDPYEPALAASILGGKGTAVDIQDDLAYVIGNDTTMRIYNISDPYNPTAMGEAPGYGYAYGIAVSGDFAYATYYNYNLVIYDISNPANPFVINTYSEFEGRFPLAISDDYLYIGGLAIINISDPYNPYEESRIGSCATAHDMVIRDTLAFLAYGDSELFTGRLGIINIADPTNPYVISCTMTENEANAILVNGDYAYVGESYGRLRLFYIADPENPVEIDYLTLSITKMAAAWPFFYAANDSRVSTLTTEFPCGDANLDGTANIADVVYIINWVFKGGPIPYGDGDANCDGNVNVGDCVYIVNYVFKGGAAPCANCP